MCTYVCVCVRAWLDFVALQQLQQSWDLQTKASYSSVASIHLFAYEFIATRVRKELQSCIHKAAAMHAL